MFHESYQNIVVTVKIPYFGCSATGKFLMDICGPAIEIDDVKDYKAGKATYKFEFSYHSEHFANGLIKNLQKMFNPEYLQCSTSFKPAYKDDWEMYEDRLKSHDWYYMMSDDHRVWSGGESAHKFLGKMKEHLSSIDNARAIQLWNNYCPYEKNS